jgi:eukaryotic-like serine/threonine-protein kinase
MSAAADWTRVKEVFQEALGREPRDRAAFLRKACGTDAALYAEVESLLAAHEQAGSFVERPAIEELARTGGGSTLRPRSRVLHGGERLGPYEILAPLDAGGMGEVYRARDTRLQRSVAIKVLPAGLRADAASRSRFEREARAIAALNDPRICTLHDIGHEDGIDFLVLEYLEGETLAHRLAKGPLPLDQALTIAIEIASALTIAHRHGIVHRDLKPGNVMLTKSGTKLLDFGLARLRPTASSQVGETMPSETPPLTTAGTLIGTLPYMAPEQLEGKEADARTDIFAFGAVLYEMVTGRQAFAGETQAQLIATILQTEPPPIAMRQPNAPPLLSELVQRCLAKDPDARFQSAQDLAGDLRWIATSGGAPATRPGSRSRVSGLAWVAAAALLLTAGALLVSFVRRAPADPPTVQFVIQPSDAATLVGDDSPAVSPDGEQVAFVASSGNGPSQLWIRRLDSVASRLLAGTEGAASPFWSPDSASVGFFANGKLKRVPAAGGIPQTVYEPGTNDPQGADWNREGVIILSPTQESPLYRVEPAGRSATPLTNVDRSRQEQGHYAPQFLPDGHHFLFWVDNVQAAEDGLYVGSLDSDEKRLIVRGASNGAFVEPGYVIFGRERTLFAQRFDSKTLAVSGEPIAIVDHVAFSPLRALFSASPTGVLAYRTETLPVRRLTWFSRNGGLLGTLGPPGPWGMLTLSPDQRSVAVIARDIQTSDDIWLFDVSRGTTTRFTSDPAWDTGPTWSPDGQRIIFSSDRGGPFNLFWKPSIAAGEEEVVLTTQISKFASDWSSDGRFLIYQTIDPQLKFDLWMLSLKDGAQTPLVRTRFAEYDGALSRDGRWLAYVSEESGHPEIYVQPFQNGTGRWRISTAGGTQPIWRADGRELIYVSLDGTVTAVRIQNNGSTPAISAPQRLFRSTLAPDVWQTYSMTSDGQRFLIPMPEQQTSRPLITVVVNFPVGLKK